MILLSFSFSLCVLQFFVLSSFLTTSIYHVPSSLVVYHISIIGSPITVLTLLLSSFVCATFNSSLSNFPLIPSLRRFTSSCVVPHKLINSYFINANKRALVFLFLRCICPSSRLPSIHPLLSLTHLSSRHHYPGLPSLPLRAPGPFYSPRFYLPSPFNTNFFTFLSLATSPFFRVVANFRQ